MANAQLTLVPVSADWKLDEETKRIGRAGLARARAALADTASPVLLSASPMHDAGALLANDALSDHDLLAA